jgi:hypothetical protein
MANLKGSRKMANGLSWIPANKPWHTTLLQSDSDIGDPGSCSNCAAAIANKRQHNFIDVRIYRTVSYMLPQHARKYRKYETSVAAYDVMVEYDINGKTKTRKRIPPEGVLLIFLPLRKALRPEYLRNRTRTPRKRTGSRRPYRLSDPLSMLGVRWGTRQKT